MQFSQTNKNRVDAGIEGVFRLGKSRPWIVFVKFYESTRIEFPPRARFLRSETSAFLGVNEPINGAPPDSEFARSTGLGATVVHVGHY
jgi:hypothetical protein